MERLDKYYEIIKHFIPTRSPNVTVVEKKDRTVLYGFFVMGFDDAELRMSQKFLFVPNAKSVIFREGFSNPDTATRSIENCIQIDVDEIKNVKLVNAHNNHVQFSLNL